MILWHYFGADRDIKQFDIKQFDIKQ